MCTYTQIHIHTHTHSYVCTHASTHTHTHTHSQFPRGDGEMVLPPQNLAVWDILAFIPPKIYSYQKTLRRSRFCEQATEMCSKDVRECDRKLLGQYFYTVKIMCVYFPKQCFFDSWACLAYF